MSKRRLSLLLLVIFLTAPLILPGCITYSFETKISPDGSGKRTLEVAMDEGLADTTGTRTEETDIEGELKEGAPKDAKYKTYTKEGKVHYQVSFPFKNVDELNKTNSEMGSGKKEGQAPKTNDIKLDRKDWLVYATYKFSERFPSTKGAGQLKELTESFSVTYKLTLPGEITEATTDDIEKGTATWDFNLSDGKKIEASSRLVRWNRIIIIGGVILGLIIFLFLIVIFTRKPRSKPRPRKGEEQPAQPEM